MYLHPELPDTHHHPLLWSPKPVIQLPDQDFMVDWLADPDTGTPMYMACPHARCLSTRFKSPAMLYRHWVVASHEGELSIIDRRGGTPVDVSFRHQCPCCNVMMKNPVPHTHAQTKACKDTFARCMAKDSKHRNEREIGRSPFKSRGESLSKVMEFNYLGRIMMALNDDSLAVHHGIAKAKSKWAELWRILGSKPILTKTFVRFYKAIVVNVFLYGCETWRLQSRSLDALEAFHKKSGQPFRRMMTGGEVVWIRPPVEPLLERTNLKPIFKYISTKQTTFRASFQGRPPTERGARSLRDCICSKGSWFSETE
jgi:hypothetical protein